MRSGQRGWLSSARPGTRQIKAGIALGRMSDNMETCKRTAAAHNQFISSQQKRPERIEHHTLLDNGFDLPLQNGAAEMGNRLGAPPSPNLRSRPDTANFHYDQFRFTVAGNLAMADFLTSGMLKWINKTGPGQLNLQKRDELALTGAMTSPAYNSF